MNLLLSFVFLACLIGLIAWIKSRGWFQHVGCTCRKGGEEHEHGEHSEPADKSE